MRRSQDAGSTAVAASLRHHIYERNRLKRPLAMLQVLDRLQFFRHRRVELRLRCLKPRQTAWPLLDQTYIPGQALQALQGQFRLELQNLVLGLLVLERRVVDSLSPLKLSS